MHLIGKRLAVVAVGFVVALAFVPTLMQSGEMDLRTVFNMSHSFTVPGKVLEPNTDYVMMVGDSQTGTRRVVRIYNDDESELLSMFLAVNDERAEPADKTTFTFIEMDEGQPQVIRSWFYPGRNTGLEFVYPREQALAIAQHAKETVLANDTDLAALDEERGIDVTANLSDFEGIEIEAIEPGDVTRETTTTAAAIQDDSQSPEAAAIESEPVEPLVSDDSLLLQEDLNATNEPASDDLIAQSEQPADLQSEQPGDTKVETEVLREKPSGQVQDAQTESGDAALDADGEELPATAGALPLLGLFGALSLGLGLGVRIFSIR